MHFSKSVKDIGIIFLISEIRQDIKYKFFIHNKQEALYRQFNALMTEENLILKIYNIF
jgi:hypothetical protein